MSAGTSKQGVSFATTRARVLSLVALACAGVALSSAPAFALKIPIQATLSGAGEVPANASPAHGLMQGTFDTDTNTLEWTVTYTGLVARVIRTEGIVLRA